MSGTDARARASTRLLVGIVVGALAGGLVGWGLPETGVSVAILGDLWLRMLRMLVLPLIVTTMIHGVVALGDVRRLGTQGVLTLAYYVLSSAFAAAIGLLLVNVVEPGVGVDIATASSTVEASASAGVGWRDMVASLVAPNVFEAAANFEILPLIVFSIAFGAALSTVEEAGQRVIEVVDGVLQAVMKLVHGVMLLAPVGIFGLVAGRLGEAGGGDGVVEILTGLGVFVAVVVAGLALHMVVVLGAALRFLGRRSPVRYARTLATALLTAFSTASSAATLPLTLNAAEEAGVSARSTRFVLPLGATINMDGSALYEAVAALFIAQAWGIELGLGGQVLVVITAILSSIGAAGIPEAGLVTMVVVLEAVGLPLEGLGLLLAVDWFLDRFRTGVNVWGDAVGAAVIDRFITTETGTSAEGSGAAAG